MDKKGITMVISKGLGEADLPNNDYQEIKAEFDYLCDMQERLYKPEFETVFKELFKLDTNLTKDYPCTRDEALLDEALRVAGFETDEAFCADFKQYNALFVEGKELQEEGVELLANNFPQRERQVEGWHFKPMEIVGTPELIQIVDDIMERDAQEGKGLYANITQIPQEDEVLDEFLCVEAYGLKCSFVPFLDELKRYGIVDSDNPFLSNELKRSLFALLKEAAVYLKEHTDKPQAIKNKIARFVKEFDSIPHWGLFLQILFLQGLFRLLEGVNIKEGDAGYNEGCSLYMWIFEQLANKEVSFCCKPYFGEDLELLKPLCAYLMNTQVGQWVQSEMFGNELQPEQTSDTDSLNIEPEQATEEIVCYEKAVKYGMAKKTDNGYRWLYNNGSRASLAYFLYKLFNPNGTGQIPYQRLERCWCVKRLDSALTQVLNAKKPQLWRTQIDDLFKELKNNN